MEFEGQLLYIRPKPMGMVHERIEIWAWMLLEAQNLPKRSSSLITHLIPGILQILYYNPWIVDNGGYTGKQTIY
jgi:hypothetical protein